MIYRHNHSRPGFGTPIRYEGPCAACHGVPCREKAEK